MIEVTNQAGFILSFDGRVVEKFDQSGSTRVHASHVMKIDIKEKKGTFLVSVRWTFGMITMTKVDENQRAVLDQFVAAVTAARGQT